MQPYLFPYLGYFQLIGAVDQFILLDDANFIKQGWVNRNRILAPNRRGSVATHPFTVPVRDISSHRPICEMRVDPDARWRRKLIRTIAQTYSRAPEFPRVWPWLAKLVDDDQDSLCDYLNRTITSVADYLGLDTPIISLAGLSYGDPGSRVAKLKGIERVIEICTRQQATEYVNSWGGRSLYDASVFNAHNIDLWFLQHRPRPYRQFGNPFVSHLSIIDALMFNGVDKFPGLLNEYRLVKASINP